MRHHPRTILAWGLVFVAACGSSGFGSLPAAPNNETSTTDSAQNATESATTTADKPELTVGNLPDTTGTPTGGTGSDPTTSTTESSTSSTSPPNGNVQVPEAFLAGVIEDAAKNQNLSAAAITVLSGKPVDWPDGSLGCPEPGMVYTQVITPGYLVVVDAGGVTLEYHLNRQGDFKQCTGGVYHPPSDY